MGNVNKANQTDRLKFVDLLVDNDVESAGLMDERRNKLFPQFILHCSFFRVMSRESKHLGIFLCDADLILDF